MVTQFDVTIGLQCSRKVNSAFCHRRRRGPNVDPKSFALGTGHDACDAERAQSPGPVAWAVQCFFCDPNVIEHLIVINH